jgi:AraC family transcriptional regulator of adaptative response/methylated-DNA-[protein]-cysteine methyltransferase
VGALAWPHYDSNMMENIIAVEPNATQPAWSDYGRIEKALGYLHSHFLEQPDLATMARAAHLSEYHFQRVFTRWAGISPKRFVQFLTIEHAKRQLADSKAVLDAALNSGLSGPGRLHDLFVSVEAVTPGEFKTRGAGIQIECGFHPTPFGPCLMGLTQRGVCWLSFPNGAGRREALREMRAYWSGAPCAERPAVTAPVAAQIFSALERRNGSSLGLLLMGTNFQIKVWQALLKIPAGKVVSYQDLGKAIGAPTANRAVGAAVGRNPIAYLIPCHRVIRKSGLLGGYHWGEPRKQAILGREAARTGD